MLTPGFRHFLTYDPRPTLRKVRCPVLAINGELDLQVPAKENLTAIREALKAGGNRDVTIQELPRLNHVFQTSRTGSPADLRTEGPAFDVPIVLGIRVTPTKRR
jgi:fermentation-respiration switch protein FrsA (DUF1100 family)